MHEKGLTATAFKTFPLIARAGSLALWNGAARHGSAPRTKGGLRVTLVRNFRRSDMRPQHLYDRDNSPRLLSKFPELARVIGQPLYPYEDPMGPARERIAPFMRAGADPFA